jgi:hypothetical protein
MPFPRWNCCALNQPSCKANRKGRGEERRGEERRGEERKVRIERATRGMNNYLEMERKGNDLSRFVVVIDRLID